jgi:branched-subunit amino acid aminotransferase/4-amino-4-deoxychorismate lyase
MNDPHAWPCVLDGAVVQDGRIAIDARGGVLSHGEGLFETLPVVAGRARFLDAHLERLDGACRELGFGPGPDAPRVTRDVDALRALVGDAFSLRVTVFRDGAALRRLLVPSPLPTDVGRPVRIGVAAERFNGPRSLAWLKTLNYLVPRLAHEEGAARGLDEVVFVRADGVVLEGTRSSVFMVEGGTIVTAPLSLPILPGVTREVILGCARRAGIPVAERAFTLAALTEAPEAFISASVRGVRAVRSVEGRPVRGCPGPLTERVATLYAAEFLAPA